MLLSSTEKEKRLSRFSFNSAKLYESRLSYLQKLTKTSVGAGGMQITINFSATILSPENANLPDVTSGAQKLPDECLTIQNNRPTKFAVFEIVRQYSNIFEVDLPL